MQADDSGDGCDCFHRVGARHIGGWLGQSGEDLAVGLTPEQAGQLAGRVAAVQIGKNQHVGATRHGTGHPFVARRYGQKGRVDLQFPVDFHLEMPGLRLLPGERRGRCHFFRAGRDRAAFGRVTQHGHTRYLSGELPAEMRGLQRNGGELFDVGRGNHSAIGHDHHAVMAEIGATGVDDQAAADQMLGIRGFDHAKKRTEQRGSRGFDAADHAVGASVLHHHGRIVIRIEQQLARVRQTELLVALQCFQKAAKVGEVRRIFRIDHAQVIERHFLAPGHFFHHRATSEENRNAAAEFVKTPPGLDGTEIFPLGKNNALGMAAQAPKNGFDKFHGLRAGRQRVRDCGKAQATSGAEVRHGRLRAKGNAGAGGKSVINPRAEATPKQFAASSQYAKARAHRGQERGGCTKKRNDPQNIKLSCSQGWNFF